jgi:predicted enzyme related to lactoylglutathione lyase
VAGSIVHLEIPAADTEQSRAFWGSLFGWEFQEFPGGPTEYFVTQTGENQGVAVMGGGDGPRAYFDVDDISAGAAQVRELGGQADDPMPVPGMGWFATCSDPHGNAFGLWQSDPDAG